MTARAPKRQSRPSEPGTTTANTDLTLVAERLFSGPKRRIGKRELMKRLAEENSELKSMVAHLHQQIAAIDAENAILSESLSFFRTQMGSSAGSNDSAPQVLVASESA
jgi:hypothetical protein